MGFSFPTQKKILELRKEGVVSYSTWLSRLIALAVIFLYFNFTGERLVKDLLGYYERMFAPEFTLADSGQYLLPLALDFIFIPSILVLSVIVIGIFLQTRFYIQFDNLGFDFSRMTMAGQLRIIKPLKKLIFALSFPVVLFIVIMLGLQWAEEIMKVFGASSEVSSEQVITLFKSIASQIAIVAVLFIILAMILNWFYFRLEHSLGERDAADSESSHHSAIDSIR